MKHLRTPALLLALLLLAALLCACGGGTLGPDGQKLVGRWAFNHDPGTCVIELRSDGSARYEGNDYRFAADGDFLVLTDSGGKELRLRCLPNEEGLLLYLSTEYVCHGPAEGLVGLWVCAPKNWSFTFTETGAFLEDQTFPGTYTVNEQDSSFTLHYLEDFADTVCYYQLDGDRMLVDYPWQLIRMN